MVKTGTPWPGQQALRCGAECHQGAQIQADAEEFMGQGRGEAVGVDGSLIQKHGAGHAQGVDQKRRGAGQRRKGRPGEHRPPSGRQQAARAREHQMQRHKAQNQKIYARTGRSDADAPGLMHETRSRRPGEFQAAEQTGQPGQGREDPEQLVGAGPAVVQFQGPGQTQGGQVQGGGKERRARRLPAWPGNRRAVPGSRVAGRSGICRTAGFSHCASCGQGARPADPAAGRPAAPSGPAPARSGSRRPPPGWKRPGAAAGVGPHPWLRPGF